MFDCEPIKSIRYKAAARGYHRSDGVSLESPVARLCAEPCETHAVAELLARSASAVVSSEREPIVLGPMA